MEKRPYLRCLGMPVLLSATGEPFHFRTKKHLALLVYLAVEAGRAHRRDRLAEIFWPNVSPLEGRHSLATALSVLRPRLPTGSIESTRDSVALNGGKLDRDLDRLLAGEVMAAPTRDELEVAEFLEGFEIAGSVEFSQWKDRQRATLLSPTKAALVQLIDRCRRTADTRLIEQLAERMLVLDDLSEEAVRAQMEARAFAGDRLTALRLFEEWKEKLADSVGAQPSALVEGMAVRLRKRGWERPNVVDVPTVQTDQWRGRCFVGRSTEYRTLYEAWEATKRGRASHALVLGDSGIGKSTLVDRLTTAAGLEGAAFSRTQCYDLEQDIPYAALSNLVTGLLDRPGVSATPPEALAEIARTVSEVRRRFPSIPPAEESQGETSRLRLTESLSHMLETIAEEHPLILVVDDLHLCDEATLSILHLILRRLTDQAIMVVLIARPGELVRSAAAARLRTSAKSFGILEIVLSPLSDGESGEVLRDLLGPPGSQRNAAVYRTMVKAAGGFPMVLELLAQDWTANADDSLALTFDSVTAEFGHGRTVPPIYRQAFDRLIAVLDPNTRHALNMASVLGHRLNDLSLYEIGDLGPGQVMSAMSQLVDHRILRDNGRGLEFVNEFIRTAAYLEVPSPVRRALHAGVAERLVAEDTRGTRYLGLEIAWHAARGNRVSDVPIYLLRGARDAISEGALDAASKALSSALKHFSPADHTAGVLLLTEALQEQGRWGESLIALLSDHDAEASPLGTVFRILAEHRTAVHTRDQLSLDLERLLLIVRSDGSPPVKLKAVNAATQFMGDIRDPTIAETLFKAVHALGPDGFTEDENSQLVLCRGQLLYYMGRQKNSYALLKALADTLKARRIANSTLTRIHAGLGAAQCFEGKYDEARAEFRAGYAIAVRIGNESRQFGLAADIALCCLRLGEYDEQLAWNTRATAADGYGARYQDLQAAYYHAFALAMRGDRQSASGVMAQANAKVPPGSPLWMLQAWKFFRTDILCLCGQRAAALEQAKDALEFPNPVLRAPSFAGFFARSLALVACNEDGTKDVSSKCLEELWGQIDRLDALDRAEITCARLLLGMNGETEDLRRTLVRQLAELPAPITSHLERLGVLPREAVAGVAR